MLQALKQEGHIIHFVLSGSSEETDYNSMSAKWDALHIVKQRRTTILKWLAKRVKQALHINTEQLDRWVWGLRLPLIAKLFKPYFIDDWYNVELDTQIKKLQKSNKYDVVIVEYVFLSKVLTLFDLQTLKILDTHDVFANRHLMYLKEGKIPQYFFTTPEQELIGLERADVVLAIQNKEYKYFNEICKNQILLVGHICDLKKLKINSIKGVVKLLFIGSGSPPNLGALEFLSNDISYQLKKLNLDFRCEVVGNIESTSHDNNDDFYFTGAVDDLVPYYQNCDIVINPVRIGTGLNIKSIEAISFGKPLITTSIGCDGLRSGENSAFLVADQAEEFAKAIVALKNDPERYSAMAESAFKFAQKYNRDTINNLLTCLANS